MPTNLYGPGDHFDLANSYVLPALIRKFHPATLDAAPASPSEATAPPGRLCKKRLAVLDEARG